LDGDTTPVLGVVHPDQPGTAPLRLGGNLQGKLDEIAVFPRALSPAEIARLWTVSDMAAHASVATTPPPPVPPLSATRSATRIHVAAGYEVELVASEPQVLDPVAFDWDARGRLWVAEMADYPVGRDNQGQPGGRIRVLEDADGDGRFERA